jgi:hypothetical protein
MSYATNAYETEDYASSFEDGPDEDIAREDDHYGRARRCTCGRDAAMEHASYYDRPTRADYRAIHDGFPGCAGCDPVDREDRPYGFGIERWEDAAYLRSRHGCRALVACGLLRSREVDAYSLETRGRTALRLERAAELRWGRICGRVETHREAVAAYKAWAAKASR